MVEKEKKNDKGEIVSAGGGFEKMFGNMMKEMNEFDRPFGLRHWLRRRMFPEFPEEFGKFEIAEPAVDVIDKGDKFEVTADIPGIPKENLEVNVTDNEIEIKGKFEEKKKEEGKNYLRRERRATSVYRRVSLPAEVISDKANAKIENGILKISLPKKKPTEEQKAKKIKIE
ncbi:Heat shock protein Hsp20 (modular protein) [groundwater metagenome]|uniref:Heat shock protein Hsp20 (Modular protein) n=2 Tax=groundwater metagenome TaxID=717931 RepID=A0A098E603_9ZZZZ